MILLFLWQAAKLPMSIIIVGVGQAEFDGEKILKKENIVFVWLCIGSLMDFWAIRRMKMMILVSYKNHNSLYKHNLDFLKVSFNKTDVYPFSTTS